MKFSDRIELLRKRLNLTQLELARLLGRESHVTISRWEHEYHEGPLSRCIEKLIQFLEKAPDVAIPVLSNLPYDSVSESWPDRIESIKSRFNLSDRDLASMLGVSHQRYFYYKSSRLEPFPCLRIMLFLLEHESDLVAPYLWPELSSEEESEWDPAQVKKILDTLNLSEYELADLLNVNHATIRTWGRGDKNPGTCQRILLDFLERRGKFAADLIVDTPLVEDWPPEKLDSLRQSMNLTIDEFVVLSGMSYGAVLSWFYRGVRRGCAARLLSLLEAHPELFKEIT